jgi:hypothetical protein
MIWVVYLLVVAACLGLILYSRSKKPSPTSTTHYDAPSHIERGDFPDATTEVFAVAFTSASCESCHDIVTKLKAAQTSQVDISIVEYEDDHGKTLHKKYDIEAVPTVVICDSNGTTQKAFLGAVTATDLWAGLAQVRGSDIQTCANH